jgi:hypothetical protein
LSFGIGELFETGWENVIDSRAVPLTPLAPLCGVVETTRKGAPPLPLPLEPPGRLEPPERRTLWLWLTCRAGDLVTK